MDRFVDKIGQTFGDTAVIAYGDWSRTDQMKNFMPTLGIGLRRLIHKKYQTFTVHEAYTSKRCSACYQDMRNYVDDITGKDVHRLMVCSNCVSSENKITTFRARDRNGATNIMNIAKYYLETGEIHYGFKHIPHPPPCGVSGINEK